MKKHKVDQKFIDKWKLDAEEIEILEDYESGKYISVPTPPEELKSMIEAAKNTLARLKKEKSITLRINEKILNKLKMIAKKEGMPYQTLIGSILYKYTITNG